jgi:hypothetical protein
MSPIYDDRLVQKATGDITDVQIYGCGVQLYAPVDVVRDTANRDGQILIQAPQSINVAVAVLDMIAILLDDAFAIALWLDKLSWPQCRALIMTTPLEADMAYTVYDLREKCKGLKVLISTSFPAHVARVLHEVLISALHGWSIPAPFVPPSVPRTLRIAFTDAGWWRGKNVPAIKQALTLPGLTVFSRHAYVNLHANTSEVKKALGHEGADRLKILVAVARLDAVERESPDDVAHWRAQMPEFVRTVLFVDITGGEPPGESDPIQKTWDYCDRIGVYFVFVTNNSVCVQNTLRAAVHTITSTLRL